MIRSVVSHKQPNEANNRDRSSKHACDALAGCWLLAAGWADLAFLKYCTVRYRSRVCDTNGGWNRQMAKKEKIKGRGRNNSTDRQAERGCGDTC